MRTKSPPVAERAPGASFDFSSRAWYNTAVRAGPDAVSDSIDSIIRMALYTLAALARPSGPPACRRPSQPESTTARVIRRETSERPDPSIKSAMTRTASCSLGEYDSGTLPSRISRTLAISPVYKSQRRALPFLSSEVANTSRSSAESSNNELVSTLNRASV